MHSQRTLELPDLQYLSEKKSEINIAKHQEFLR